ncbi:MAG: hypothetical protein ABGX07_13895 [Pirellulaceae bacterium]
MRHMSISAVAAIAALLSLPSVVAFAQQRRSDPIVAAIDTNNDGKLSESELNGRGGSRSAMGGFLKGHSKEIDRNGDGILTRNEAIGNAERMFAKMDRNGDDKITAKEMAASRRE